jgi:hypothetical protein
MSSSMTYARGSRAETFGTDGEQTIEQWLRGRGWGVVRLCTIRNYDGSGAPLLMGSRCNLILPDFQVLDFTGRHRPPCFVEVKHKAQAVECYKLGHRLVHGIGRWNWQQYCDVERQTDVPVWMLLLEAMTGELLALRVAKVTPDDEFGGADKPGVDAGGMVYWLKSRFVLVAELARIQGRLELESAA